jgi:hypothetical protein
LAWQFSVAVRNALLDAIETNIGVSAKLMIYTGAVPANCAAATTGTKLVEWDLASDWAAAASGGTKTFNGLPIAGTAVATGTAGYVRLFATDGTTCGSQGTVTLTGGGGDMTIDNTSIATSQAVNVTGFTWTAPGA